MNEKIYKHRKRILAVAAFVTISVLLILTGYYIYIQSRVYSDYEVVSAAKRKDSAAMQFAAFHGNILKYGKDGASCIDANSNLIWNQTYEMQSPMADICQGYAVIADEKGKQAYIMNKDGPCGQIEATMPIHRVRVANQGMVVLLMAQNGTGYLQIYDKDGGFLAEGELHTKNSGYPLDVAISHDGKKMAVSLLDMNEGSIKTTVTFYNFGSTGQNEIDNIVSQYSYEGTLIPKLEFLSNDVLVAFGDDKTLIFEGAQKPQLKEEIQIEQEIQSIFYNEAYFGLVFTGGEGGAAYEMQVYDLRGTKVLSQGFSMGYQQIGFLENDEICVINDLECAIFSLRGVEKFHGEFEKSIRKVMSAGGIRNYIFLIDGETQRVRLK